MSTAGRFNKLERLGDGTYGVVYKAQSRATRDVVALKRMNIAPEEEGVPATTLREIALLKELHHGNVVTLIDLMFEAPKLTLVFEYCEWDLKKYMDGKGQPLSLDEIKHFLRQLLEGIAYLHQRSVVHRDLKPQNLLICDLNNEEKHVPPTDEQLKSRRPGDLALKLADFGLARIEGIPVKKYSHEAVTLWYRSPDVIMGSTNYGLPVDMWSVGCIFAEMASGVPLFNARTDQDQLLRMFKILGSPTRETWPSMSTYPMARTMFQDKPGMDAQYPPALEEYARTHNVDRIGPEGLDLLQRFLKYEPSQRITAMEALNHPFFHGMPPSVPPPLVPRVSQSGASVNSANHRRGSLMSLHDPSSPANGNGASTSVPGASSERKNSKDGSDAVGGSVGLGPGAGMGPSASAGAASNGDKASMRNTM